MHEPRSSRIETYDSFSRPHEHTIRYCQCQRSIFPQCHFAHGENRPEHRCAGGARQPRAAHRTGAARPFRPFRPPLIHFSSPIASPSNSRRHSSPAQAAVRFNRAPASRTSRTGAFRPRSPLSALPLPSCGTAVATAVSRQRASRSGKRMATLACRQTAVNPQIVLESGFSCTGTASSARHENFAS